LSLVRARLAHFGVWTGMRAQIHSDPDHRGRPRQRLPSTTGCWEGDTLARPTITNPECRTIVSNAAAMNSGLDSLDPICN
jgi:hypothetical protein